MIKQLLSIAFVAGTFAVSAQQNLGFENWSGGTPDNWDAQLATFASGSITQITTGAPEGTSAVQLTTSACGFCGLAGLPGRLPGYIQQSVASTTRPVSMSFYLQANVMAGDEAAVIAQLTKWNGSSTDVIGQAGGTIPGGTVVSGWTIQNSTFQYVNGNTPDTLIIGAASSDSLLFATSTQAIGSTISIDAIVITNPVGIQDVILMGSKHVAYPNPANSVINFTTSDDNARR